MGKSAVAGTDAAICTTGWSQVASRGLLPLHAMRERAALVTARSLDQRLPADAVPTELAELATTLNEMLARLEEAFVRLSDFSSDIAHELRTPISNLMTQTQVALSRSRSAEEYRTILESNAEEYEHMARMIADMLLLAKADNGLAVPHKEVIDLAVEFRALFDYYDAVAEEKFVGFSLNGNSHISADKHMLRRALGNLLSNAIRHAHHHTSIDVFIQDATEGVEIRMDNTGDIIPSEYLDRIFERFFRIDSSRQRSGEGTGLGLAITKSIVEAHGGTISATSSGVKTALTIRLPRSLQGSI